MHFFNENLQFIIIENYNLQLKLSAGSFILKIFKNNDLFLRLCKLRQEIAAFKNLPEFMVFSNTALVSIAHEKPTDLDKLNMIKGVEQERGSLYGNAFIGLIADYLKNNEKYRNI